MHPIPFLVRLVSFAAVFLLVPTPATAAQSVAAFTLTNGLLQLSWQVRSNYDSQLEESANLSTWRKLWPPHPAPLVDGVQTDLLTLVTTQQFYRVGYGLLTNSPVPTTPGNYSLSVVSGGLTRTYRLVIPLTYSATTPAPLAFLLHGHGQTADSFASQHPDLRTIAQASGLLLVFPQSTVSERGTGWVNYDPVPGEPYVDDRQFLLDLLGHLGGALNIDRQRVFAGGFSNGGQMVHYLGARTTNVFAALAAVGSSIGGGKGSTNMVYIPPAAVPMPILIVNATNDCARPFWGGTNDSGTLQPAALEAAIQWTTNINACLNPPVLTTNTSVITWAQRPNFANDCPDYNPTSGFVTNLVTRSTWLGCTSSVEVVFVTLTDGGHLWPDAADLVGFDANAEVLGFFLRHCRCEAVGAINTLVVPTTPGQHERSFCDQGFWRKFRLMIPTNYTGAAASPVLFTFHGGKQTVADFSAAHPDLFAKCNAEGVILVLPEATVHPETRDTLWGDKPFNIVVDDRRFVTNLLEQIDGALNLDRKRTYAAGFSNGGEFTSWLGSTRTGLLAAIAAVGSTTGWVDPATGLLVAAPPPLEPMPVMLVRGTADTQRPFNGSASVFSAAADLSYWASGDACVPPQLITTVGPVTAWHFNNCAGTSEAKLEGVAGLGHEWPEAPGYNASLRVVDFLLLFTRP